MLILLTCAIVSIGLYASQAVQQKPQIIFTQQQIQAIQKHVEEMFETYIIPLQKNDRELNLDEYIAAYICTKGPSTGNIHIEQWVGTENAHGTIDFHMQKQDFDQEYFFKLKKFYEEQHPSDPILASLKGLQDSLRCQGGMLRSFKLRLEHFVDQNRQTHGDKTITTIPENVSTVGSNNAEKK